MKEESFKVYILFSEDLSKYYVGVTATSPEARLKKHLSNHKGFTGRAKDWVIIKVIAFEMKDDALRKEKEIKKRGIRRWIEKN